MCSSILGWSLCGFLFFFFVVFYVEYHVICEEGVCDFFFANLNSHIYLESQIVKYKEGESQTAPGGKKNREKVGDRKLNMFGKASLPHRALD